MNPEQIRMIQERLAVLGYRVPVTGMMDEATMQAIAAYNTIQRPREAGAFNAQRYPMGDFTLQSGEGFAPRGQTPTLGAPSSGLAPYLGPQEKLPTYSSPMMAGSQPIMEYGFAPREAPVESSSGPVRTRSVAGTGQPEPEPTSEPRPMTIRKTPTAFPDHPMPPPRPVEMARGVLSAPSASGPSSRDLWTRYNRTEDPADFVRADQAMLAGRAAGGRAPSGGGGKHDAVSKALEIIHHLIMRGR